MSYLGADLEVDVLGSFGLLVLDVTHSAARRGAGDGRREFIAKVAKKDDDAAAGTTESVALLCTVHSLCAAAAVSQRNVRSDWKKMGAKVLFARAKRCRAR